MSRRPALSAMITRLAAPMATAARAIAITTTRTTTTTTWRMRLGVSD